MYDVQNGCVFGHSPISYILKTAEDNVSEAGSIPKFCVLGPFEYRAMDNIKNSVIIKTMKLNSIMEKMSSASCGPFCLVTEEA
jgi:hypothetical protein